MNSLNANQLRAVVAELAAARSEAAQVLGDAELHHRRAVRKSILAGTLDNNDETAAAVEGARRRHHESQVAHDEAAVLLVEAQDRERDAEKAAVRAEVAEKVARLEQLSRTADEHFAAFVGALRSALREENESRRLCEVRLQQPLPGGAVMAAGVSDAAGYLRSLQSGSAGDLEPFAGNRAALAARRIKTAAGI